MPARVFLAVWPDTVAGADAAAVVDAVRADPGLPTPWRWQPPHRWHVTAVFVGDVPQARIGRITRAAAQEASATTPGPLAFAGAGLFGPVLWLGASVGPWLADLHRRLARRVADADRGRPFRPHLTVARWRGPRPVGPVPAALADYRGPAWTPAELTVVLSHPGPQPRYEVLSRHPLAVRPS